MQLVAYGAQDIYLTGNPQITFFKVVYRRHTNFSMESIQQTFSGQLNASGSGRVTSTISRNGDLVHRLYLEVPTLSAGTAANPGIAWIDSVEVEIGGQTIDRHYGHWMETWSELSEVNPEGVTARSSASGTMFQLMSYSGGADASHNTVRAFVPLQFWFCRNPGLALPLIALQYHEVTIIIQGQNSVETGIADTQLWADYIYLDTDERRRFAQVSHEYLIEQLQFQTGTLNNSGLTLNFNHPVKELIWTQSFSNGSYSDTVTGDYQLKLNGHDRFAARDSKYFTRVQVWQYHTGVCGVDLSNGGIVDNIAVYSFALRPEEHQPSGTCNFSRIDTAVLQKTDSGSALSDANVYAVNYNVLRIMSGMGGLAYSN